MTTYVLSLGVTAQQAAPTSLGVLPNGSQAVSPLTDSSSSAQSQSYQVTVTGVGNVSATYQPVVSNDGINWLNYGSAIAIASGAAPQSASFSASQPWLYYSGYFTAISGTNARGSCLMQAASASVPSRTLGTVAQMIAAGPTLGAVWVAADLNYTEWIGKVNPAGGVMWAPRGGLQTLYQRCGTVSAPLTSMTGSTSGSFSIPGGNVKIPAGLLVAGVSQVHVWAAIHKAGIGGSAGYNVRLGINGTTSDNMVANITSGSSSVDTIPDAYAKVGAATTFTAQGASAPQTGNTAGLADRTTQFNVASDTFVSLDMSAGNSGDTHGLVALAVQLLG